jgi:sporulation protein YlmC with PRC-barrel domain
MSFKTEMSAAALALMLALGAATAQQVAPPETRPEAPRTPVAGQIVTQPDESILARDLIGQTVTAPDSTKIGTISDLVLSGDGRSVQGFVIGVGGFLGIGERNVALKMDQLKMVPLTAGGVQLTADLKKEDLSNAPAFKSRKDIEAEKRAGERPTRPSTGVGGPSPSPSTGGGPSTK